MNNTIIDEPLIKDQVHVTSDYHKFSFVAGNRKVNMAHVRRLERSMASRYLFSPIIINEFFQIIDGQHRFTVCKKLHLPIRYITVNGYGLDEVKILNTNASNWKKIDYLNAYCDLRYPEYLKFKQFMQAYPKFGFQTCEMLLANKTIVRTSEQRSEYRTESNTKGHVGFRTFEDGDFKCVDYNYSCSSADKIISLSQYTEAFNRKAFIAAMIQLFKCEQYDHDEFLGKLAQQPTALVDCVNVSQYKSLIEEIYNYKRKNKVNLRF